MTKTLLRGSAALLALVSAPAIAQEDGADVIVVTASPLDRTQDELLTGASVLDGEALRRQAAATIGETLRLEPGVSSTGFGAGASRPIIRGLGGDRVRVLTNGVGTIDAAAASPDHAVPIEPALAERIEVLRGTGLLRYGSSAAGGVVNVLDGRLPSVVPEDGLTIGLRADKTTVDEGTAFAGGMTAEAFEAFGGTVLIHGSGSWRDAGDYELPGFAESAALRAEEEAEEEGEEHSDEEEVFGLLENSYVDQGSFAGGLSFVHERGFLAVAFQRNNTNYGIPGGHGHGHGEEEEGEEHSEEGGVFIGLDQDRWDLNGRLDLGGFFEAVQIFAGLADYEHTEFEGPGEPGTVFANQGWETRVELLHAHEDSFRGATGIQIRDRDFSAIGEEAFVPPTTTQQIGLYTFEEFRAGPWHVEGALRYEATEHERSTDGFETDFDGLSVSLGAGYEVTPNLSLNGNVFRTERAPTTEELFSDGPHLATDAFELGDVDLGLETATGIEGLVHVHGERGNITLNLFYTDYADFIYQRDLGVTGADILIARGEDDEEELEEFGELDAFAFTAADAAFSGFELFGSYGLGEVSGVALGVDGVLDYVNAELDEGGNLPRIPPLAVTVGVDADWRELGLRAEVEHAAEQDDVAAFERPTDSYTLLNLYGSYQITDELYVSVAGLNLTDEEARQHTSFLKDVVPLPGRNVRFSIGYGF